jgi:hypothetical protein
MSLCTTEISVSIEHDETHYMPLLRIGFRYLGECLYYPTLIASLMVI